MNFFQYSMSYVYVLLRYYPNIVGQSYAHTTHEYTREHGTIKKKTNIIQNINKTSNHESQQKVKPTKFQWSFSVYE